MSFSPLVWKSFDLSNPKQEQLFMGQLTDLLNFLNSGQGLSTLLNGNFLLGASAMNFGTFIGSAVTTNQTFNCAQAASISGLVYVTTVFSPTVTFTNMVVGTPFSFRFTNAAPSPVTLIFTATNPAGSSYGIIAYPSGSAPVNMVSGLSVPAGNNAMFSGSSYATNLDLLVNVT